MTQRREFLQLGAAALAAAGLPAFAQDAYPSKPVTMLVPFPPGGVADTVGRPVAEAMGRALGQTMIVENKGGAGGGIGMAQVAKSRADGYSVLMSLSSVVVLPEADKVLKRNPLYTLDQLKPIARFTADPTALVVRADSPWKTYKDFIAHVKAKPGQVTFGSSGNYGTMHVPMEQLKVATGTFMLHVPYTGAGPAVLALLAGQIDALSTGPSSVMQHVRAGKLRVLAHWGEGRLAALPEVPSFKGTRRADQLLAVVRPLCAGRHARGRGDPAASGRQGRLRRCARQAVAAGCGHLLHVPGRARVRAFRADGCQGHGGIGTTHRPRRVKPRSCTAHCDRPATRAGFFCGARSPGAGHAVSCFPVNSAGAAE